MKIFVTAVFLALIGMMFTSCASYPAPGTMPDAGGKSAKNILKRSSDAHGDLWKSASQVQVDFEGEWTGVAKRLQPVLVDSDYRVSSTELYDTCDRSIRQVHTGPAGKKEVQRTPDTVSVRYDGRVSTDGEVNDATALVADAYRMFLFGSSYLVRFGSELSYVGSAIDDGKDHSLIQGVLKPGLGLSERDHFIAWIDESTGYLRRLQFTLNGLAATKGADVDVTFTELERRDGFAVPARFVEFVQRPLKVKAHDWRMVDFRLNPKP